ncbi:hypothetical protein JCM10213_000682 [Rhodosporidiobolus nylandii]
MTSKAEGVLHYPISSRPPSDLSSTGEGGGATTLPSWQQRPPSSSSTSSFPSGGTGTGMLAFSPVFPPGSTLSHAPAVAFNANHRPVAAFSSLQLPFPAAEHPLPPPSTTAASTLASPPTMHATTEPPYSAVVAPPQHAQQQQSTSESLPSLPPQMQQQQFSQPHPAAPASPFVVLSPMSPTLSMPLSYPPTSSVALSPPYLAPLSTASHQLPPPGAGGPGGYSPFSPYSPAQQQQQALAAQHHHYLQQLQHLHMQQQPPQPQILTPWPPPPLRQIDDFLAASAGAPASMVPYPLSPPMPTTVALPPLPSATSPESTPSPSAGATLSSSPAPSTLLGGKAPPPPSGGHALTHVPPTATEGKEGNNGTCAVANCAAVVSCELSPCGCRLCRDHLGWVLRGGVELPPGESPPSPYPISSARRSPPRKLFKCVACGKQSVMQHPAGARAVVSPSLSSPPPVAPVGLGISTAEETLGGVSEAEVHAFSIKYFSTGPAPALSSVSPPSPTPLAAVQQKQEGEEEEQLHQLPTPLSEPPPVAPLPSGVKKETLSALGHSAGEDGGVESSLPQHQQDVQQQQPTSMPSETQTSPHLPSPSSALPAGHSGATSLPSAGGMVTLSHPLPPDVAASLGLVPVPVPPSLSVVPRPPSPPYPMLSAALDAQIQQQYQQSGLLPPFGYAAGMGEYPIPFMQAPGDISGGSSTPSSHSLGGGTAGGAGGKGGVTFSTSPPSASARPHSVSRVPPAAHAGLEASAQAGRSRASTAPSMGAHEAELPRTPSPSGAGGGVGTAFSTPSPGSVPGGPGTFAYPVPPTFSPPQQPGGGGLIRFGHSSTTASSSFAGAGEQPLLRPGGRGRGRGRGFPSRIPTYDPAAAAAVASGANPYYAAAANPFGGVQFSASAATSGAAPGRGGYDGGEGGMRWAPGRGYSDAPAEGEGRIGGDLAWMAPGPDGEVAGGSEAGPGDEADEEQRQQQAQEESQWRGRWPTVKVENIPFSTTMQDVLNWIPEGYLAPKEEVVMPIHLVLHRATGRTLPHCYLETVSHAAAQDLIRTMDRSQLGDRTVRVKWERAGELMRDFFSQEVFFQQPPDTNRSPAAAPLPHLPPAGYRLPAVCLASDDFVKLVGFCHKPIQFRERPFERAFYNMVSLIAKFPWYRDDLWDDELRDEMYEAADAVVDKAASFAKFNPLFEDVVQKLVGVVLDCPAFTDEQKTNFHAYNPAAEAPSKPSLCLSPVAASARPPQSPPTRTVPLASPPQTPVSPPSVSPRGSYAAAAATSKAPELADAAEDGDGEAKEQRKDIYPPSPPHYRSVPPRQTAHASGGGKAWLAATPNSTPASAESSLAPSVQPTPTSSAADSGANANVAFPSLPSGATTASALPHSTAFSPVPPPAPSTPKVLPRSISADAMPLTPPASPEQTRTFAIEQDRASEGEEGVVRGRNGRVLRGWASQD